MEKQKVTVPKREKILRVIAKAAQAQSLVGGDFYTPHISESGDDGSLNPSTGCKSAGRCAMAELFFATGYSNNKLAGMSGNETGWEQKDFRVLWDNYRIDAKDAERIISANDDGIGCSLEDMTKREKRVAKVVNGLKDRVRVNPYRYLLDQGEKVAVIATKKEKAVLRTLGLLDAYEDHLSEYTYGF